MSDFLSYTQRGHVVTLTMNQPEKRNPLTGNTAVDEFVAAVARIEADPGVRAVILTGADPAFSAGGDIRAMREQSDPAVEPMRIRNDYRTGIHYEGGKTVTTPVTKAYIPVFVRDSKKHQELLNGKF